MGLAVKGGAAASGLMGVVWGLWGTPVPAGGLQYRGESLWYLGGAGRVLRYRLGPRRLALRAGRRRRGPDRYRRGEAAALGPSPVA